MVNFWRGECKELQMQVQGICGKFRFLISAVCGTSGESNENRGLSGASGWKNPYLSGRTADRGVQQTGSGRRFIRVVFVQISAVSRRLLYAPEEGRPDRMMNYIKSECYRVVHTKTFYIVMAVLSGLVLLMNTVNSISGHLIPDFRYDTFRFSLNSFTSFIMLMHCDGRGGFEPFVY